MEVEIDTNLDGASMSQARSQVAKVAIAAARLELSGIDDKIAAEKKKLSGMTSKHEQACEEYERAIREIQKESDKLFEAHNRLEANLRNVTESKDAEETAMRKNQIQVEISQNRKKMEQKQKEGSQYLSTFSKAMAKKERIVKVQAKVVQNLLFRKLALTEKVQGLNTDTETNTKAESTENTQAEPRGASAGKTGKQSGSAGSKKRRGSQK